MADLILPQTSDQICQTLSESYTRLICGFVGPVCLSSGSNSGFCVQNANGCTSIIVGNSFIEFCENNLFFNTQPCDLIFALSDGKGIRFSGENLSFFLSENGDLILGNERDLQYNGIQLTNANPSLILKDNECETNVCIKFIDRFGISKFHICSQGESSNIYAECNLNFSNFNSCGFTVSGNYFSFNCNIDTGYNFNFSGSSYFNGDLFNSGELNFNNLIQTNNPETGLNIDYFTNFSKKVVFSGEVDVQNLLCSEGGISTTEISTANIIGSSLSFSAGSVDLISGDCSFYECSSASGLCSYSGNFNDLYSESGCLNNLVSKNFLNSGFFCSISTGNFCVSGVSGIFIFDGQYNGFYLKSLCSIFDSKLSVSCGFDASQVCATGTGINSFSGTCFCSESDMVVKGLINSCSGFSGPCLNTTNLKSSNSEICCSTISKCLCVDTINPTIFCTSGQADKSVCIVSGNIYSCNTPKSFGLICFCDGAVVGYSGFNICSIWSPNGCFYSIKFKEAVKAPFNSFFSLQRDDYALTGCNAFCCCISNSTIPTSLTFSSRCSGVSTFVDSLTSPWEPMANNLCYYEQPFIFSNASNLIDYSCCLAVGCKMVTFLII
jgi:hypothetical protein